MPCESQIVSGFGEQLVSAVGIGVAHVVQNGNRESALGTGGGGGGEFQDLRRSGAIGGRDLVVVGRVCLQSSNLDVVEELAALSDGGDQRAWRCSVVSLGLAGGRLGELGFLGAPIDAGRAAETERSLEVNVDAIRDVGKLDDIDVVCRVLARGRDGRGLD